MNILRGALKMIGVCILADFSCTEVCTRMNLRHLRWIVDCILRCISSMFQAGGFASCAFDLSLD